MLGVVQDAHVEPVLGDAVSGRRLDLSSVRAVAGPTPGTEVSSVSRTRHTGDLRM